MLPERLFRSGLSNLLHGRSAKAQERGHIFPQAHTSGGKLKENFRGIFQQLFVELAAHSHHPLESRLVARYAWTSSSTLKRGLGGFVGVVSRRSTPPIDELGVRE